MRITDAMTAASYTKAKAVFEDKMERDEALDFLADQLGMNRNSAADYIQNFKCMMEGTRYTRTNNTDATDYYLRNILSDYGPEQLKKALKAVDEHVIYYESLGRGNLQSVRSVYDKYSRIVSNSNMLYPDDIADSGPLLEGIKKQVVVNSFERNPRARQECLAHYGTPCFICAFDFGVAYGDIGAGFIHVHHLTQLSTIGEEYEINPVADLRPVCPNCHAMLHRRTPPYTVDELRSLVQQANSRTTGT